MPDSNPLDDIQKTYLTLENNFETVYDQCDAAQKKQYLQLYNAARDAYWKAIAEGLADGNEIVQAVQKQLQAANKEVIKQLKGVKDVVAFLKAVTEAVTFAASIVTMAAA